jgi:two-component system, response regulator
MSAHAFEVLLAEDSTADAELVLHSLTDGMPVQLHVVHDGEEALDFLFGRGAYGDRAAAPLPRLVLLDRNLPVVDGLQVLRELRHHPRTWALPVVLLTSSNLEHDVVESYRLGANSFVQKPLEFTKFRELVRRLGEYWLTINEPPPAFAAQLPSPTKGLPDRIVREVEVSPVRGSETIFLVEDEAAVRVAARRLLDRFGYHVIEAPDAEEALALAVKHSEPIHLLLTDIVMPRMNGRELAMVFTRLHPEARVMFMSGYTDDEVLRRDVSHAESWYLQKPFSPAVLDRKVREALDAPRDASKARA